MEITLYKNLSDTRVVSKALAEPIVKTVTLKGACDVVAPVFELVRDPLEGYYNGYNYLYVKELNRYYYVNITLGEGGILILRCTLDPLKTYDSQIRNLTAYVERQEGIYNPYINDPLVPIAQGTQIKAYDFGSPHGANDTYNIFITCIGATDSEPEAVDE